MISDLPDHNSNPGVKWHNCLVQRILFSKTRESSSPNGEMEASIRKKRCSTALLQCSPRLKMLSRITATQFILDVPNKFLSAVSMSTVSPRRKAKLGMLQSALATRENRGGEGETEGEEEKAKGMVCDAELCSQTFDRLALMSSTQSLL